MAKTVLITGSSSGFGKDAALLFKKHGWNVAATMRSPEKEAAWTEPATLWTPKMDVTNCQSMRAVVDDVVSRFGGIDVLINNAGFGMLGPLEGALHEDIARQFDTNVLGVITMTQLVLPHMRAVGAGVIINVSSVGGRLTLPLYATYHATKFAVEGLTEALQYELADQGIRVKLVEPGAAKTDFGGRSQIETPHPAYRPLIDGVNRSLAKVQQRAPGTEKVVQTIYRAATDGSARLRYPVLAFPYLNLRNLIGARGWSLLMKGLAKRLSASAAAS